MRERLARVLTTMPKNLDKMKIVKGAGVGSGIGALAALLLSSKRNRLRNTIISASIGGLLGGYLPILRYNAETEVGGHYTDENPDHYDPKKLVKSLNKDKKEVVFYVSGAGKSPSKRNVGTSDLTRKNNVFTFSWADGDKLAKVIKAIPKDYDVRVVAHSAGGTILSHLDDAERDIKSVDLLDPVDLSPYGLRNLLSIKYKKPDNIKSMLTHIPETAINIESAASTNADKYTNRNPFRVMFNVAGSRRVVHPGDSHSLDKSGLRLTERILANFNQADFDRYLKLLRTMDRSGHSMFLSTKNDGSSVGGNS